MGWSSSFCTACKCEKDLLHSLQIYDLSLVCTNMCVFRCSDLWKDLTHWTQSPFSSMNQAVYFQSLSKTKCLIASSACVIFHHCGLTCEFSSAPPDEIFYCIQHNCPAFPHYVSACDPLDGGLPDFLIAFNYLYRFSPLWVIMWLFRCPIRLNNICVVFTHYE